MGNKAFIYSSKAPSNEQMAKFKAFLKKKYNKDINVTWLYSTAFKMGFRLVYQNDIFDYNLLDKLAKFEQEIKSVDVDDQNIIPLIKEKIEGFNYQVKARQVGKVLSVMDGVVKIEGLKEATYGEIIHFESGVKGMVQFLNQDYISCILFSSDSEVHQGDKAYRTLRTAGIMVGEEFLGRVVDPLGNAIDGLGEIKTDKYYEIEREAPSIIDRRSVYRPLETGILTIDSMFPIGRGQRELIIGDRQTGKTAIALDAILNQKGKGVICIYVAIGQKASSVALLVENLRKRNALDYTIVVAAFASDPSSILYIAPYAATSLGEYFMENGKDVLIVYDDLSKHAIAYRTISLLLGRAPGREAYPGDVFYLHSRLLERSSQLNDKLGGGSMTALPIVETQASDVSAYIPTNIISITDGQIFLESDMFNSGQRPAINIGLSVSRVGGDAQTKAVKNASGTLRLDLSQYREMEVFTQFASDLDDVTKNLLVYGKGLMEILKQGQYSPLKQYEEVIVLVTALNHLFINVDIKHIKDCEMKLLAHFNQNESLLCESLENNKTLDEATKVSIIRVAKEFIQNYLKGLNDEHKGN